MPLLCPSRGTGRVVPALLAAGDPAGALLPAALIPGAVPAVAADVDLYLQHWQPGGTWSEDA